VPDYTEKELTDEELAALLGEMEGYVERPATPEELVAAGAAALPRATAQPRRPVLRLPIMKQPAAELDTFALRGAEAVPAGGMLTDLLGTGVLQAAKRLGVGNPGAVIPPQAQAELYQLASKEGVSPAVAEAQIRDPGNPIGGATDTYRLLRDTRRKDTKELTEENPWSGRLGEGVGTVASILAPLPGFKAAPGAGMGARLTAAAKTGAAYGGLSGFANDESDLSRGDWRGTIRDVVDGGLGGAAFGLGAGAIAEGASKAWPYVRRYAINKGKEVLSGSSDMAAVSRKPLRDEAVEEVLASGGIKAFDTTPQTHERVASLADEAGFMYGQLIDDLEAAGVRGPDARKLARSWLEKYEAAFNASSADKGPASIFRDEANNLRALVRGGKSLGLSQAEGIKRTLQKRGKFYRREANPMEESVQEASSDLRQAIEDAVEKGGAAAKDPEIRSLADAFVPAKQRTGRLLEAEEFIDRAASKYSQKPNVSMVDRLMGAASSGGNPIQAEANARAMSLARRRLPSAAARYSYDLSQALETGAATPALSKAAALGFEPSITDTATALADYLLEEKRKKDKGRKK
jgi:hypothetical protein